MAKKAIEITFHEKQRLAYQSDKRVIACVAGKQGGKTTIGGLWARKKTSGDFGPKDNAIIAAPTSKIFAQSTLPKFREYFGGLGKWNKKDMSLKINGRGTIWLRSMHDPDACEGITNVRWIWADEAGKLRPRAWDNIQGRAAVKEAPILLTTTPYSLNWLFKDVYKPWKAGNYPEAVFYQWPSIDNPYFPKAEYERQKLRLDPRVFAMAYNGTFEKMQGLVYPDLDDKNYENGPIELKSRDYYKVGGIDFGYNNPLGIVLRALHRQKNLDYQFGEYYRRFRDTKQMIKVALFFQREFGIEVFYADSEDPRAIADLAAAGVKVQPVIKDKDSVRNGIITHNALIRSKEYKLIRGKNPNTEDEYITYHYPEESDKEENLKETPVDSDNHLMDANRYISMMTKEFRRIRYENNRVPSVETQWEQEEILYGMKKSGGEDWYDEDGSLL